MAITKPSKHGGARANTGRKLAMEVQKKLEKMGCDPFEGMANIAMANHAALGLLVTIPGQDGEPAKVESTQQISIELRAAMYRELAQYVAPKRRAIDIEAGSGSGEVTVQVVQFTRDDIQELSE